MYENKFILPLKKLRPPSSCNGLNFPTPKFPSISKAISYRCRTYEELEQAAYFLMHESIEESDIDNSIKIWKAD